MLFEQIRSGGCLSYLIGCDDSCAAMIVDPHLDQLDRYIALAARARHAHPLRRRDAHARRSLLGRARARPPARRAASSCTGCRAAPFPDVRVDDGESLIVGKLRVRVMHTPGHTDDSMCLVFEDRVLTGDTLLDRRHRPHRSADRRSGRALRLACSASCCSCPTRSRSIRRTTTRIARRSTIGAEKATNPRLQKNERADFVALMRGLDLKMPDHLTEALRTNRTGGKTVAQLLAEASREIAFMAWTRSCTAVAASSDFVLLDVREKDALRGRPPAGREAPAARPARAARRQGAAGSERAHPDVLPVRPDLDARGGDAAHDGLHARGRARRRLRRVGQGRLPDRELR